MELGGCAAGLGDGVRVDEVNLGGRCQMPEVKWFHPECTLTNKTNVRSLENVLFNSVSWPKYPKVYKWFQAYFFSINTEQSTL